MELLDLVSRFHFKLIRLIYTKRRWSSAPGLLADADDTAKTMIALSRIGRKVRPDRLILEFDNGSYFVTNKGEKTPSVATNSIVLLALLHLPDPYQYAAQISRVADYLCSAWNHGSFTDRWVCVKAAAEDWANAVRTFPHITQRCCSPASLFDFFSNGMTIGLISLAKSLYVSRWLSH